MQRSFSLDNQRAHRDQPVYFRRVREETRKAISDGAWLLECLDNLVEKSLNPPGFLKREAGSEVFIQISFRGQAHVADSYEWRIFESVFRDLHGRISRRPAPVDLSVDSMVRAALGYSVAQTCLVVADLVRRGETEIEFVDGKTLVRFSPRSSNNQ